MKRLGEKLGPVLWTLLIAALAALCLAYMVETVHQVPLRPRNFRFERPWACLLLPGALLVLLARGWWYRRRSPRLRVSRARELALANTASWPWRLRHCPTGLRTVAVALMAVALMGPQSIHARDSAEVEGIDIVLALDLSLSMQAADIKPNRFAATQQVVDYFIERRPNDRIGAVVFGRDAYTLLPLTTDHQVLRTVVADLQLGMIEGRGTAIGNAIGVALNRVRRSTAKSKVIILATDGDSNSGNVSPAQAAEFARTLRAKIYTILMGRSSQALVQQGVDLFGRPVFDRGNFPINPELLKAVASKTGGEAFEVTDREGLERSFHTILDRLEKSEIEDPGRTYGELFPIAVGLAVVLVVLELLTGALLLRRWP